MLNTKLISAKELTLTTDSQQLKQFTEHEYNCSPRKIIAYISLLMLIILRIDSYRLFCL